MWAYFALYKGKVHLPSYSGATAWLSGVFVLGYLPKYRFESLKTIILFAKNCFPNNIY